MRIFILFSLALVSINFIYFRGEVCFLFNLLGLGTLRKIEICVVFILGCDVPVCFY